MSDLATVPIPELVEDIRAQDFGGNPMIKLTMNILANRMLAQHERIEQLERYQALCEEFAIDAHEWVMAKMAQEQEQ